MDHFTLGTIGASLALSYYLNNNNEPFQNETENTEKESNSDIINDINEIWDSNVIEEKMRPQDINLKKYIEDNDIENIKKYLTNCSDPKLKKQALDFINKSQKFLEPENINTINYISQTMTNDKKLSDFTNNNFVPFISKSTQNMAGTGIQSGNFIHSNKTSKDNVNTGFANETPHATRLGIYTGRDITNPRKTEFHKPNYRFKPQETTETYVNGMPVIRAEHNRFETSTQRPDLKPCEQIQVGPGLNCGSDSPACDGFHNTYRPEQTYITNVDTNRGAKNKAPPGSYHYTNKSTSNYAKDVGSLDINEEGFTQEKDRNTFISKKCAPQSGRNGSIKFETNRGNQERPLMDRSENSRNQENTYSGPTIYDTFKHQMVDKSYTTDTSIHKDSNRTELEGRTGHAYMNNGHSDSKEWYANNTMRGVENNHILPGSIPGKGHIEHFKDKSRTTIKETTLGESKGHAYFGRGQHKTDDFYNATFSNKPLASSNPNPAGPNILADPHTRAGNFILNRESNATRAPTGHQNTHFRNNSEYQIRKDDNIDYSRISGGLTGYMNTPYSFKPLDSRADCKA